MIAPSACRPQLTLLSLALALAIVPTQSMAREPASTAAPSQVPRLQFVQPDASVMLHGGAAPGLFKAAQDSFNLYGGVRSDGTHDLRPEGQFQDFILIPKDQGWFGVDRTENPTFWHVSTFNAEALDPAPGNQAMWSGVEPGTSGFVTPPGYGNGWNDVLQWRAQTNPTVNTDVRITFEFNHDTEPGYDFFYVEFDSAGSWITMATFDGTNKDGGGQFVTPVSFDQTVTYTPLMYTGVPAADVRLRLRVQSDSGWSDEDGLWPTRGAVQSDNIRVYFNGALVSVNGDDGVASFEDLGGSDDTEGWTPVSAAFAGDFSKVIPQLRDIDPCRDNWTPQLGFIDDGTPPSNSTISTGGATSPSWNYGVLGAWVVNYEGGISFGTVPFHNEFWSPEIAWDDTTSTEDDGLLGGAFMRFSIWQHLPLENGIFWTFAVRSQTAGTWTGWRDRGFVYFGDGGGSYVNDQEDVTDLLVNSPDAVQIAFGAIDLANAFEFPGIDATPSPMFDNVSFWRYSVSGPAFATRNIDVFNDGFPNSGSLDLGGDLSLLSVRMDVALDVSTGPDVIPGDSLAVSITPALPGTALAGLPVMKWILDANPLFSGVRSIPAGSTNIGPGPLGWDRYLGTVVGDSARTANGIVVNDRFFFDFPNDGPAHVRAPHQVNEPGMFFPGDKIRYFIEASDTGGNTSSLPADTTGYADGAGYSRVFSFRALPTVTQVGIDPIDQPDILILNDFGHRGGENDFLSAFGQIGMFEGKDYDVYTTTGPSSAQSNGIGSSGSGGATPQQLDGYSTLIYFAGNLSDTLISDGSNLNGNDKSPDTEVLTQWHNLTGDRFMLHFGDDLADFMNASGATNQTYLSNLMSVQLVDTDLRDEIGGQASPLVEASVAGIAKGLLTPFVAFGGCQGINQFDSIIPIGTSEVVYDLIDPFTLVPFNPPGGVWYERVEQTQNGDFRKVDITFPFGFLYVYNPANISSGGVSARSLMLKEILENFYGSVGDPGAATGTDAVPQRFRVDRNVPNPFNPVTKISFAAPARGNVAVRVFNVRGELVRVLHDGIVEAGDHEVQWNGTDSAGAKVASGIYLYQVEGFGERVTQKMALVK